MLPAFLCIYSWSECTLTRTWTDQATLRKFYYNKRTKQVVWERKPAEMVAEQRSGVVGLAYFHIPLREYGESDSIVVAGHLDTLADMRPQGYTGRMIGCPRSNTGLYNAMRRQRNVWAVSVVSGSVNVFVSW